MDRKLISDLQKLQKLQKLHQEIGMSQTDAR